MTAERVRASPATAGSRRWSWSSAAAWTMSPSNASPSGRSRARRWPCGAADPLAAGRKACEIAADLGLDDRRCAVLLGDDMREALTARPALPLMETGAPLESILPRMASANAYLGADAVGRALATGAPIVMTGRVADPSLFVAPIPASRTPSPSPAPASPLPR